MSEGAASVPAPERQRGSRRLYFPTYRGLLLQSDPAECIGWERVLIIGSRFFALDDEGRAQRIRVVREADTRTSSVTRRLRERGIENAVRNGTLDVLERNPRNPFVEMLAIRTGSIALAAGMLSAASYLVASLLKAPSLPAPFQQMLIIVVVLMCGCLLFFVALALNPLRQTAPRSIRYSAQGAVVQFTDRRELSGSWTDLKSAAGGGLIFDDNGVRRIVRLGAVGRAIAASALRLQAGGTRRSMRVAFIKMRRRVWLISIGGAACGLGAMGYLQANGAVFPSGAPWVAVTGFLLLAVYIDLFDWLAGRVPRMRRKWRRWWMSRRRSLPSDPIQR